MCSSNQKDGFICPGTEVFGTASIIVSRHLSSARCLDTTGLIFLVGCHRPGAAVLQRTNILVWLITASDRFMLTNSSYSRKILIKTSSILSDPPT